jgi:hypothetical protein
MSEKRCLYKCGDWNCGSYQFNLYKDAIDQGELCDVHYWQTKAQRPWQGLTVTTILNMMPSTIPCEYDGPLMEFARAVEASLKELNK